LGQSSDYKKLTLPHLQHPGKPVGSGPVDQVAVANESYVLQPKFNALRTDVVVCHSFGILWLGCVKVVFGKIAFRALVGLSFGYP